MTLAWGARRRFVPLGLRCRSWGPRVNRDEPCVWWPARRPARPGGRGGAQVGGCGSDVLAEQRPEEDARLAVLEDVVAGALVQVEVPAGGRNPRGDTGHRPGFVGDLAVA